MAVKVGCVLLAAGSGRRFGCNKLLAQVEGVPLYRRAMAVYAPVPFARRVVVSRHAPVLQAGAALGFAPVYNARAEEGIAASVRLGTAAMMGLDGALFAVCDQPYLSTKSIFYIFNSLAGEARQPSTLSRGLFRGVERSVRRPGRRPGHLPPPGAPLSGGGRPSPGTL